MSDDRSDHQRGVRLTVVLPCWNEERVIGDTIAALADASVRDHSIVTAVVVDDGSTDGTWAVLRTLASQDVRLDVRGIRLDGHHGKAVAQAVGLRAALAGTDFVAVMDSDGQHDPAFLDDLLTGAQSTGSPCVAQRIRYKRRPSRALGVLLLGIASFVLGYRFDPRASEFMVLPASVARQLSLSPRLGIVPILPLVTSLSKGITTVPVRIPPRQGAEEGTRWGVPSLWQKGILQLLADPWSLLPRIAAIIGVLVVLVGAYGLAVGIVSLVQGSFLGVASILVALVLVFAVLSALIVLTLGVAVVAFQSSSAIDRHALVADRIGLGAGE